MLPQAVSDHYGAQQRLIVATLGLIRREWAAMGEDFDASWSKIGPRLLLLTASAQLGAARAGASYVPRSLVEVGQSTDPLGEVDPGGFSGWASDGRALDSLLYGSVITAKVQVRRGAPPIQALAVAGRWLDMAVHTQVVDAGRQAASVAIAARPKVGWLRMVNAPCCSRCAILAGKWFRWNQGFRRHPRCDCVHVPAAEDSPGNLGTDPAALFASGQVRGATKAELEAIQHGANPSQVINARRGMTVDGLYTSEGTTRRGYASYVRREIDRQRGQLTRETATNIGSRGAVKNYTLRRVGPRPTPEAIMRYATSREDAMKLLAANGYVIGDIRAVAASASQ